MTEPTILLWEDKKLPQAFNLKIDQQRYLGLVRTDRTGQSYWKFKKFSAQPLPNSSEPNSGASQLTETSQIAEKQPSSNEQLDLLTKFQQRQSKTEQINTN